MDTHTDEKNKRKNYFKKSDTTAVDAALVDTTDNREVAKIRLNSQNELKRFWERIPSLWERRVMDYGKQETLPVKNRKPYL